MTISTLPNPSIAAVIKAITAVMADLAKDGISKDRKNEQQHYAFRGIDDVYNALSPLLSKHGLVILPDVQERELVERTTKSGGALSCVTVKVRWTILAHDGSSLTAMTWGEAHDSADKATNKAMSAAYKYLAFMLFAIPTEGDNDADAATPEPAAKPKAETLPKAVPFVSAAEALAAISSAGTHEALRAIGGRVASSAFDVKEADAIRAAYSARRTSLNEVAESARRSA